jgi:dihydroneopterin aldolase
VADHVFVRALALDCVIGVEAHERASAQRVVVDLDIETDCRLAARSDAVELALDYAAVATRTKELVESSEFTLIETLAGRVSEMILSSFPRADRVTVRVSKPMAVANAAAVGVEITRARRAGDG